MDPFVDIVMPVRNAAETLNDALESISQQTFVNWRLVAVDDGSIDDSVEILQAFRRRHGRTHLAGTGGRGLVAALNEGLRCAAAPLIARMDADDRMYPERLQKQVEWLARHPDIGVTGCRVDTAGLAGGFRAYVEWSNGLCTPGAIANARFIESPIVHPTVCFRWDLAERHGAYREGDFPEDYELWLRWMEAGVRFGKVDEVLLHWRDRSARATRVDPRYRVERFFAVKGPYLVRWLDRHSPQGRRVWIWGAGRPTRLRLRPWVEQGLAIEGLVDVDPRKIGTVNHDGRVVDPGGLPGPDRCFVLAAVGRRGAREEIRERLDARGFLEGLSYLCVA